MGYTIGIGYIIGFYLIFKYGGRKNKQDESLARLGSWIVGISFLLTIIITVIEK